MTYFLNQTLYSLESRSLLIRRENASAGCFIAVFEKGITSDEPLKGLGDIQVIQEGIEATLINGEKIFIPNVKLNSYGCSKDMKTHIPEIESMLTQYLTHINNNTYLFEQNLQQNNVEKHK